VVNAVQMGWPGTCSQPQCCLRDWDGTCLEQERTWSGGPAEVPPPAYDPDGDPLELTIVQSGCGSLGGPLTSCPSGSCPAMTASLCEVIGTCAAGYGPLALDITATDSLAGASGTTRIWPTCP